MAHLLFVLLLHFGNPKYKVEGSFYSREDASLGYSYPAREICRAGSCEEIKIARDGHFHLKLRAGDYEVRYTNIWNQLVKTRLHIQSDTSGIAFEMSEFLPRDSYPVWDSFAQSGQLSVDVSSRGCFHHNRYSLTFDTQGSAIHVRLIREDKDIDSRAVLTEEEVALLRDFLQKIDLFNGSFGCTTEMTYVFHMGDRQFTMTDGSCDMDQLNPIILRLIEGYDILW